MNTNEVFITNLKFVLNSNLTAPWIGLYSFGICWTNEMLSGCGKDQSQSGVFGVFCFFLFLPPKHFCFVTLDTQTFPNLNKENPAFLCWNPMSQVHFLGANKYFQFTDRNLTKPGLQLSRLHQRHCPRTPIGQDICFPSMDSGAPGRKDQG